MVDVLDASTETVLKIKPRECAMCGGKFIPTARAQKYCQDCRRKIYAKGGKTKMQKDTEHVFGPAEKEEEKPELADEEPKTDPAAIREAEAEARGYERARAELERREVEELIRLAWEVFGVRLMRADEVMECELNVGGKIFGGIYVARSTWEGGVNND